MRSRALVLLCGLAAAAGCSRSNEGPAAPTVTAGPFTPPHPRAGLWKTSIDTSAGPGVRMTGELCLDEGTKDAAFSANPRWARGDCSKVEFSPNPGGGVAFATTCKAKGRTITTRGVATGDFSSRYSLQVTTRMDPPLPGGARELSTKVDAAWVGACRDGQKPGQLSMKFAGLG